VTFKSNTNVNCRDFKNTSIINSKVRIDLTEEERRYESEGMIVTSFLERNNNNGNRYNGEEQGRNVKEWTLE
jgi:hypothetical protein